MEPQKYAFWVFWRWRCSIPWAILLLAFVFFHYIIRPNAIGVNGSRGNSFKKKPVGSLLLATSFLNCNSVHPSISAGPVYSELRMIDRGLGKARSGNISVSFRKKTESDFSARLMFEAPMGNKFRQIIPSVKACLNQLGLVNADKSPALRNRDFWGSYMGRSLYFGANCVAALLFLPIWGFILNLNIFYTHATEAAEKISQWLRLSNCNIKTSEFLTLYNRRRRAFAISSFLAWAFTYLLGTSFPILGKENLKSVQDELVVFVANHTAFFDILATGSGLGRSLRYVAKKELFSWPFLGVSLKETGALLVDRDTGAQQLSFIREAVAALRPPKYVVGSKTEQPTCVFVFPEGTRSKNGRLKAFKPGLFSLAVKTGVRVVPVSIIGGPLIHKGDDIFPFHPNTNDVMKLHVHKPIDPIGLTEEEIMEVSWLSVASALPQWQKPLDYDERLRVFKQKKETSLDTKGK